MITISYAALVEFDVVCDQTYILDHKAVVFEDDYFISCDIHNSTLFALSTLLICFNRYTNDRPLCVPRQMAAILPVAGTANNLKEKEEEEQPKKWFTVC
jgi:hypothetical protein